MREQGEFTPRVVLVTGGAGFIGSNYLLRQVPLYPQTEWVNLDALTYAGNLANLADIEGASNHRFVRGDIADRDTVMSLFEEHGFDTVVHFAAESHVDRSILDPLAFVRANALGTATLLDAARRSWSDRDDCRFHHVSTDEVFGSLGPEGRFNETTAYDPRSPYSASKAAGDHLVRAYAHTYGLPVVISNCSNNYGPYQFPEKLIPLVIQNAVEGKSIPVYGSGENVRDWIYVVDHCSALDLILRRGRRGETYLVGGEAERSNIEIVRMLVSFVDEALGRERGTSERLIGFVKDRPGHDFRYAIDCSRVKSEIGWSPEHTLEDGLKATVAWYLSHRDWVEGVLDQSYRDYYRTQYSERT